MLSIDQALPNSQLRAFSVSDLIIEIRARQLERDRLTSTSIEKVYSYLVRENGFHKVAESKSESGVVSIRKGGVEATLLDLSTRVRLDIYLPDVNPDLLFETAEKAHFVRFSKPGGPNMCIGIKGLDVDPSNFEETVRKILELTTIGSAIVARDRMEKKNAKR